MSESLPNGLEQDRLPILNELEAQAVLAAQADIAATRFDAEGNPLAREAVTGVTANGTFVSVDYTVKLDPMSQKSGVTYHGDPYRFDKHVVRTAALADLAAGGTPAVQAYEEGVKTRSSGPLLKLDIGMIHYTRPAGYVTSEADLPRLYAPGQIKEHKKIYPIGPDGQPYIPGQQVPEAAPQIPEPEQDAPVSAEPHPGQVSVGGLRGLFKRRR